MAVTKRSLELSYGNLVRALTIQTPTHFEKNFICEPNMAEMRDFVMCDEVKAHGIWSEMAFTHKI
jgi:hypothetical protein